LEHVFSSPLPIQKKKKRKKEGQKKPHWTQWLMPIIPATWEVEIGRIAV
jgi:hypothetical protein